MGRSSVAPTVQQLTLEVGEILTELTKTPGVKLSDAKQVTPSLVVEVKQKARTIGGSWVCVRNAAGVAFPVTALPPGSCTSH
ncbi:MAG: hypothetical protein CM1200mP41_24140 [Gammaproteobacteria bacterium]|nr:MAG: hypothetical protein CM1200mP41_24140 [Gammaproteobacteria bacterium]